MENLYPQTIPEIEFAIRTVGAHSIKAQADPRRRFAAGGDGLNKMPNILEQSKAKAPSHICPLPKRGDHILGMTVAPVMPRMTVDDRCSRHAQDAQHPYGHLFAEIPDAHSVRWG